MESQKCPCRSRQCKGDKKAVEDAFNETDIVLTTGGLGPTKDDITKQTLCDFFGGELIYDKEVEKMCWKLWQNAV